MIPLADVGEIQGNVLVSSGLDKGVSDQCLLKKSEFSIEGHIVLIGHMGSVRGCKTEPLIQTKTWFKVRGKVEKVYSTIRMSPKGKQVELSEYFCHGKQRPDDPVSVSKQPLGATIFTILDTTEDEFYRAKSILMAAMEPRPDESHRDCLLRLYKVSKMLPEVFSSQYLAWILILLPQAAIYQKLKDTYEAVSLSSRERDQVMLQCTCGKLMTKEDLKAYYKRVEPSEKPGGEFQSWIIWELILQSPEYQFDKWLFGWEEVLPYFCDRARNYLQKILYSVTECIRLKSDLPFYIANWKNQEKCETAREIENALAQVSDVAPYPDRIEFSITCTKPIELKKDFEFSLKTTDGMLLRDLKSVNSISALVAYEIAQIKVGHRLIRQCALCGRYFIPYSTRAKYCHRPNPKHANRPCFKIGPQTDYRQRHRCGKSPMEREFSKNKRSYDAWVRRNLKKCTSNKEIVIEIRASFFNWFQRAEDAVNRYRSGKMTEAECRGIIGLPKPKERSEKLRIKKELFPEFDFGIIR